MSTSSYSASLRFRAASNTHFATSSDFRFGRVLPVMIPTLSMELPQRSIGAELLTDAANLRLSLAQRLGAGVHRVIAEDEVMRMLCRRTEHKARLALRESPARDPRRGRPWASRSDWRWLRSPTPVAARPTAGTPSRAPARERRCARHRFRLASTRRRGPAAHLAGRWSPRTEPLL